VSKDMVFMYGCPSADFKPLKEKPFSLPLPLPTVTELSERIERLENIINSADSIKSAEDIALKLWGEYNAVIKGKWINFPCFQEWLEERKKAK